ncbi:hypothetical protein F2Q68_00041366 [Brassica cretica]|uniref:Uncharacterized protein n=1 Tax=Brassica cretica TaxID=69181 RepID=A0A8S9MLV0_BRACR|nr:hypothetical protein F2Q68_00041366 [Brassica cretica]
MSVLSIIVHHLLHPSGDLTEMSSSISSLFLYHCPTYMLSASRLSSSPGSLTSSSFSLLYEEIHLSPKPTTSYSSREGLLYYTIMVTLLVLMTKVYAYNSKLPDKAVLTLYAIHIYLSRELILAATATMVRAMSSLELEPQFNKPCLATSLQEFWGRR